MRLPSVLVSKVAGVYQASFSLSLYVIDFMDISVYYYSVFTFTLFIVKKFGGRGVMNLVHGSLFSSILCFFSGE